MTSRACVAALSATLLSPIDAAAQTGAGTKSEILPSPPGMSSEQLQGVSCIITGLLTAAGAVAYSGSLASAVSGVSVPWLIAPVIAGGYAVGCSVGATTGPGAYWLYARFSDPHQP